MIYVAILSNGLCGHNVVKIKAKTVRKACEKLAEWATTKWPGRFSTDGEDWFDDVKEGRIQLYGPCEVFKI